MGTFRYSRHGSLRTLAMSGRVDWGRWLADRAGDRRAWHWM